METTPARSSEEIIQQHMKFAMVGGAIPIPVVDIAAVTALQMDMLKQLAAHYNVDFNQERGKSLSSSIFGATIGTMIGRAGASAVKAIPGIGTILGIGSQVILAGASTWALGKAFDNHFSQNGNLFDVNMEKMKEEFQELFQKGKDLAESLIKKTGDEDISETLRTLKSLADDGVISQEEFEKAKSDLLAKLGS